jgi:hypothetical protein
MIKRLLLSCLALAAVLSSGCMIFKKSSKPKDSINSNEVENTFRQRWIDKRAAELLAQGQAAEAARTQATDEFRARYGSMGTAQK